MLFSSVAFALRFNSAYRGSTQKFVELLCTGALVACFSLQSSVLRMLVCSTAKRRVCSCKGTLVLDVSIVDDLWLEIIRCSEQVSPASGMNSMQIMLCNSKFRCFRRSTSCSSTSSLPCGRANSDAEDKTPLVRSTTSSTKQNKRTSTSSDPSLYGVTSTCH